MGITFKINKKNKKQSISNLDRFLLYIFYIRHKYLSKKKQKKY